MLSRLDRRLFLGSLAASAQDEVTFKSSVNVVNVLASARDRSGQWVRDLAQAEFTLLEDGAPQKISYFSRETDLPLRLGLLMDTSMSQSPVLDQQRGAAARFFDRVLRDNIDQVFLQHFDMGVYVKQKLTGSRCELDNALAMIDSPSRRELRLQVGGGTLLFEAVRQGARTLRAQPHRKAMIVLTDGLDTGSEATLADAIEEAQRADVVIYGIYFPGATSYAGVDGERVLARMAKETGGAQFSVNKRIGIEAIFTRIEEELRSQYSIGFVSNKAVGYPAFRKLRLTTARPGVLVRCREGYWPVR